MRSKIKGQPYCDYCGRCHPWPRHCRWCGAALENSRTLYCGGFESPCGTEWAFTHASWAVVRRILIGERGAVCEECGRPLDEYAPSVDVANAGNPNRVEVHHIYEVAGGSRRGLVNRRENLLILCHEHHQLCTNPPQSKLFWHNGRAYPWKDRRKITRPPKVPKIPVEQAALF